MQRSALLLMAVSTMLVLGGPPLAAEEAQRGRARGRGSGQVTAAPQSKSPAPSRAARRVSSNGARKSTGSRSTSPPRTRAPRRSPRVQSSAPPAGRPNTGTAVRQARPRHSVSPPRSKVTTVTNGRVSVTSPTRRVGGEPSTAIESSARRTGRPNTGTTVGRARARGTVTAPRTGRVTVIGGDRPTSRTRTRGRGVGAGSAASTTATAGAVRVGRGSRNSQSQAVRRPPGDINVVGRAVRRTTPLITSPGYAGSGRAGSGSRYRSNRRYGYSSFGYRTVGGRRISTTARVGLRHRHVYYPGYVQPRLYGSFFYLPGYSFNLGVGFGSGHGYGYGYGYGHYPYGYSGYAYSSYGAYSPYGYLGYTHSPSLADPYTGFLRLKVRPRDAQVYVDGYYVGIVDEFDGVFQRLRLEEGPHQIEIRHPAYLPLELEVLIVTGEKVTFEGELYRP